MIHLCLTTACTPQHGDRKSFSLLSTVALDKGKQWDILLLVPVVKRVMFSLKMLSDDTEGNLNLPLVVLKQTALV